MRLRDIMVFVLGGVGLSACSVNHPFNPANPLSPVNSALPNTAIRYLTAKGPNVLPIGIGQGSVCGKSGYVNEPCGSVTVCVPGTTTCQVISDVLIDTGSAGLRIFSSALEIPLERTVDSEGNELAECAQFGTGSDWGPLATADVYVGGKLASNIPIQIIDKEFSTPPSACTHADEGPEQAGFNGILGIGLFHQDCGEICAGGGSNGLYYACDGEGCRPSHLTLAQQVQNPVPHFSGDNNGLLLALPQIDPSGAANVSGVVIFGIGTQENNIPEEVGTYSTDKLGNFTTILDGQMITGAFIDSGSNGLLFPNLSSLPHCSSRRASSDFYCPNSSREFTASNLSRNGNGQAVVYFSVGNAESLVEGGRLAFNNLGGKMSSGFDWGLPFFFGRAVFEGVEGQASVLGTGPYWAY